jgi:hypothetical protein
VRTFPRRGPRLVSPCPRGVEHRGDRFLAICVVARDVDEFPSRTRQAVFKSVNQGSTCRAIFEHRDGVVVGRTGEFSAALGEALDVLTQALSRLLLVVGQLPLLAGAHVRAL